MCRDKEIAIVCERVNTYDKNDRGHSHTVSGKSTRRSFILRAPIAQ